MWILLPTFFLFLSMIILVFCLFDAFSLLLPNSFWCFHYYAFSCCFLLSFLAKCILNAIIYLLLVGQALFFQKFPGRFLHNYWFLSTTKMKCSCQSHCFCNCSSSSFWNGWLKWDMTQHRSKEQMISFFVILRVSTHQTPGDSAKVPSHRLVHLHTRAHSLWWDFVSDTAVG